MIVSMSWKTNHEEKWMVYGSTLSKTYVSSDTFPFSVCTTSCPRSTNITRTKAIVGLVVENIIAIFLCLNRWGWWLYWPAAFLSLWKCTVALTVNAQIFGFKNTWSNEQKTTWLQLIMIDQNKVILIKRSSNTKSLQGCYGKSEKKASILQNTNEIPFSHIVV